MKHNWYFLDSKFGSLLLISCMVFVFISTLIILIIFFITWDFQKIIRHLVIEFWIRILLQTEFWVNILLQIWPRVTFFSFLKMMKKPLQLLKRYLSKKFPEVTVGFYLSRRGNFVHMGLDVPLFSVKDYPDFIDEINKFHSKDLGTRFELVNPQLVLIVKWKFNYIISWKVRKEKWVIKFVPKDLSWYECNGLMTWYDQCKCEDFLRNTDQHQAKIINFEIICREYNGEEVPKDLLKHYQTLNDKAASDYPEPEQDKILSSAFRTIWKDFEEKIFFEKKAIKNISIKI